VSVVLQDAIPKCLCRAADAAWPAPDWIYWHRYQGPNSDKYGSMDRSRIPPACLAALDAIALSAIPHIGDSFIDYDLHAAGMHMIPPGGFVGRHCDAVDHPTRPWIRTHSIVLCVNEHWESSWGGELLLYEGDSSVGGQSVMPRSGQAIVFQTPNQWHEVLGVSRDCPTYRRTLALFAWSKFDGNRGSRTAAEFVSKEEVYAPRSL